MKIETINPLDIIPIEAPHKPNTVRSIQKAYENPRLQGILDSLLPYAFVHRIKDGSLYTLDGHHRIAVAHMYGRRVNAIFLNSVRDLSDAFVLRDLCMVPHFDLDFKKEELFHLTHELPEIRKHALRRGVSTYDDFVKQISKGIFWSYSLEEMSQFATCFG